MPHYLKVLLGLIVSVFILTGCNFGYTPDPQKDIALFQPFIEANINKKSDDPYISSTVKPGDKLYYILVNIQHGNNEEAYKYLKPLLDEGDPEAQFWYAKMIYMASIKSVPKSIGLYRKSAQSGNAYAQFELSPLAEGCMAYFGKNTCTQENLNKAIEMFKQKAKQGDLRAQYFLLRMLKPDGSIIQHETYFSNNYNFTHSEESRQHYIKEVIRFAEHHYYQPLMDYVDSVLIKERPSSLPVATPKELEPIALNLLQIAANNNYIPAINKILEFKNSKAKKDDPLFLKGQKLASRKTLSWQMVYYTSDEYTQSYTPSERYYFGKLAKSITGSDQIFQVMYEHDTLTAPEKAKLDEKVENQIKTMTPMIYIDGFTSRDKWVD